MTLRTVDLFAGCGGLSLGFQKEKYNIVAAFELWDAGRLNVIKRIFRIQYTKQICRMLMRL